MKILIIITRGDTVGGAQVHVRDLATALVARGQTVQLVTGAGGPLSESLAHHGIQTVICPDLLREIHPVRDLRAIARLRQTIRAFAPDLVCTHSSKAGMLGRIAAKLAGVPCLFTAHGWAFADGVPQPQRTVYRALERLTAPLTSRMICVSEHDRQLGIRAGIRSDSLVTIHNGIPDVSPDLRARPDTAEPVRLAMVARFDRQKDHRTLIEAVHTLDGIQLDLVGDGPALEEMRRLVEIRRIADRVQFLGRRTDVPAILARAQIFVLSTHWEGFPLAVLEAMAAGLPVVVSDVGGAAEAMADGTTGFVVPPGDAGVLRNRLALLIADPERRAAMGAAARKRYEAEFTFDRMFERTLDLYSAVVEEDRHAKRHPQPEADHRRGSRGNWHGTSSP